MADGAKIEGVELITIAVSKENDKGNSFRLRLVQWVIDGVSKSVKLEKRNFFRDAYGEVRTGKADGFTLRDLEACKEHWPKIMDLMKNPPAVKTVTDTAVAAAKEILGASEVPF
jgi:hypothetical protein